MSSTPRRAIAADHVFDGHALHRGAAVVVEGERIAAVVPRGEIARDVPVERLPDGAWLVPGFVDVQVNGGGDVLFNDDPTPAAIHTIAAAHRRFGTTALLPTFITDRPDRMAAAVASVEAAMAENPSVLGIHLEGPFISPERPGVHHPAAIRRPTMGDVEDADCAQGALPS
jgi:N-acetylglucosamine-6-phosphate deacetylase